MTTEEIDMTTDESLLSSLSEHKVEELRLQPYSLMRQVIAADLCPIGCGGFWRAVMNVWVCTISEDQALAEHEDIKSAKKHAFVWAESRGYNYLNYKPLMETYKRQQDELVASVSARVHETLGSNGDAEEIPNDGGQPG